MATDICLPIAKFSFATGVRHDNTIPWTHIVAENLYVIATGDAVTIPGGKLSMRVVQGTTVLESVNLGDCIDQATVVRANATRGGMFPSLESLPIFGLTKDTALAIRYRLGDSKPRRIQLRMQSVVDCRQLSDALRQRGLEFQDQRPETSRSATAHVRPDSNESQPRLLTTQANFGIIATPSRPPSSNPFRMPNVEAGSFSQQHPFGAFSKLVTRVDSAIDATAPPRQLSRDTSLAPRDPLSSYPVLNRIQTHYSTPDLSSRPRQNVTTDTAASTHFQPVDQSTDARHPTSYNSTAQWSSSEVASIRPNLGSSEPFSARPWTSVSATTAPTHLSQSLGHELPPRRELPFKRPDSRRSDGNPPTSRPSSSVMTLPPLPKPKLARDQVNSASSTLPASAKEGHSTGEASRLEKGVSSDAPSGASAKRALPMNELLWGAKGASEQLSSEVHREVSIRKNNRPFDNHSQAQRPEGVHHGDFSSTNPDSLESMHAALLSSIQRTDARSLEVFAKQSNEERLAALDAFMVDKLQDPNFITLCEDVENCWRRVGFG